MELNVVICGDKPIQLGVIESYINKMDLNEKIDITRVYSGKSLNKIMKTNRIDVIFLDVEMEERKGIELGECIREENKDVIIILISEYKDYAFEAFKIKALDYMIKPITEKKLQEVMKEVINNIKEKSYLKNIYNVFTLKEGEKYIKLSYDEIYFFEKSLQKIRIHTQKDKYEIYGTLKSLKQQLDNDNFIQCHQGYIINRTKICEYNRREVYVEDIDEYVPVSKRFNKKIKQVVFDDLLRQN
ncbi:LytR/AlgR family response regulator transcription factor [Dethiothermospora halolimnae]|uniref:LytR/AlgR family response regulator transcription factor n=1 Tax=Dethiothermospora halolimnae TaxID=3114390 RepID=UPI003CCBDCDE